MILEVNSAGIIVAANFEIKQRACQRPVVFNQRLRALRLLVIVAASPKVPQLQSNLSIII
jgi:hypothetical protein